MVEPSPASASAIAVASAPFPEKKMDVPRAVKESAPPARKPSAVRVAVPMPLLHFNPVKVSVCTFYTASIQPVRIERQIQLATLLRVPICRCCAIHFSGMLVSVRRRIAISTFCASLLRRRLRSVSFHPNRRSSSSTIRCAFSSVVALAIGEASEFVPAPSSRAGAAADR